MSIQLSRNRGLNLEKELQDRTDEDWLFGGTSTPCIVSIPLGERSAYLPFGETQRGREDTMDCASRAPVNVLETKFNYMLQQGMIREDDRKWLIENKYITEEGVSFSDAFVAINSGTTRQGNSLKAPIHAIHKHGLIPKTVLPLLKTMTWDEYHNPARITDDMRAMGLEFLRRFPVFYERISSSDMLALLTNDLIVTGGYAWTDPVDGIYPPTDADPNHAFVAFDIPQFQAFDNYPEDRKGLDYIKHLAPDYKFLDYGYRVYIGAVQEASDTNQNEIQSLIERLMVLLQELLAKLKV